MSFLGERKSNASARIGLAALGGTVAYLLGGILFAALPSLGDEVLKYPAVFRTQDDMKRVMPIGMTGIVVEIVVVGMIISLIYAPATLP